jgi:type II restriction enzyme
MRLSGRRRLHTHAEIQAWLRDLGKALGYGVWVAANDRNRPVGGGKLSDGCLADLPGFPAGNGSDTVRLIDVLWVDQASGRIVAAYEVEHTTSIYSGIVRMLDLALGTAVHALEGMFLVAPDGREDEVRAQLSRPAFSRVTDLKVRYLPYGELTAHRENIARFGSGMKPIQAISRVLQQTADRLRRMGVVSSSWRLPGTSPGTGSGPPSTPTVLIAAEGVDGRPAPAMTMRARRRPVSTCPRFAVT